MSEVKCGLGSLMSECHTRQESINLLRYCTNMIMKTKNPSRELRVELCFLM